MLKPIQLPLLVIGIALFAVPAVLYSGGIAHNVENAFSDPFLLIAGIAAVLVVAVAVVKWGTRDGRTTMV
jgi:hypothetical protein